MPELPEVETVKRGLSQLIIGKTIASINYDWAKSFPNAPNDVEHFVITANIVSIQRRAKVLLIELSSGYTFVVHLKMTGQLVFRGKERYGAGHPSDSLIGVLPDKSTRISILFTDNSTLYFNDQRKFGWMRLYPTVEVPNIDFFKKVGPEPLGNDLTNKIFIERCKKRSGTTIKAALLDQTIIAGVGNIYADESLWGARLHPATRVKDITDKQFIRLLKELRFVLQLAIEKGGSTDRNYVNAEGKRGSYIDFARVFRREGLACPRCGNIVEKTRVAGRGTHICNHCQKRIKLKTFATLR
jgi:formamidopyrimidine-DNA glycosylase